MLIAEATLVGTSPYSQSAPIRSPRETGESHDVYEARTWRERMHVGADGKIFIPPGAIKNMLVDTAQFLAESVKGKGKATWTKHFTAGVMVAQPIQLDIPAESVAGERLFLPSDGKRGGGSRVWKTYPMIPAGWRGKVEIMLIDPQMIGAPEKVHEYLRHGGLMIGIGRFRPRNGGYYGRFRVEAFETRQLRE